MGDVDKWMDFIKVTGVPTFILFVAGYFFFKFIAHPMVTAHKSYLERTAGEVVKQTSELSRQTDAITEHTSVLKAVKKMMPDICRAQSDCQNFSARPTMHQPPELRPDAGT